MSRFLSGKHNNLVPYTPGEQPKEIKYIKLNTNESPFPASEKARKAVSAAAERLELYSDPECRELVKTASEIFGVEKDEILFTNGSDEILNFAFMAFCDENNPAVFPDITYGFYPVFAQINSVAYAEIPLKEDFSICVDDYIGLNKTIFIANPNAPTGLALPLCDIERIVSTNPNSVVVIDEAYVDFGAQSAVALIHKYDNLLVTQTFSKSRSMAGARLGFGIACRELIKDLNTIKYSTNPYNINSMTMAAGIGTLKDEQYTRKNCNKIIENRRYLTDKLNSLGFTMPESSSNFVFCTHPDVSGRKIYEQLKKRGILVRHFEKDRLSEYNRITVGTKEQINALCSALEEILEEEK